MILALLARVSEAIICLAPAVSASSPALIARMRSEEGLKSDSASLASVIAMAATPPFMSADPRPMIRSSTSSAAKGG